MATQTPPRPRSKNTPEPHGTTRGNIMKRLIIIGVGLAAAAVPTVLGVAGNTSLTTSVPVKPAAAVSTRTPAPSPSATDDHGRGGRHAEPGDDKGGLRNGRHAEPGDDKGGLRK